MEASNDGITENIVVSLGAKADILFQFVMRYKDYTTEKTDYGTGEYVCMTDVHTLKEIASAPGITVSAIAKKVGRTKSAISQIVRRLENMNYVYRVISADDRRIVELFPTESGLKLNHAHLLYDAFEVSKTFKELLKTCSLDDIDAFFRVVEAYSAMLSE